MKKISIEVSDTVKFAYINENGEAVFFSSLKGLNEYQAHQGRSFKLNIYNNILFTLDLTGPIKMDYCKEGIIFWAEKFILEGLRNFFISKKLETVTDGSWLKVSGKEFYLNNNKLTVYEKICSVL